MIYSILDLFVSSCRFTSVLLINNCYHTKQPLWFDRILLRLFFEGHIQLWLCSLGWPIYEHTQSVVAHMGLHNNNSNHQSPMMSAGFMVMVAYLNMASLSSTKQNTYFVWTHTHTHTHTPMHHIRCTRSCLSLV